jgi:hypothetical protein
MSETVFIYGLQAPRSGELRYVGKARQPQIRLAQHLASARRGEQTYKARWLRDLIAAGLKPNISIIEETSASLWEERERFWIEHFKSSGARLTNATSGGEGGATMLGKKFSEKHRQALSSALKGHAVSERSRETFIRLRPSMKSRKFYFNDEVLFDLYVTQRLTASAVAAKLGSSKSVVLRRLGELGITRSNSEAHRGQVRSASDCQATASLTPDEVREIRALIADGKLSLRKIAFRFNVHPQTICYIKSGATWRWLT